MQMNSRRPRFRGCLRHLCLLGLVLGSLFLPAVAQDDSDPLIAQTRLTVERLSKELAEASFDADTIGEAIRQATNARSRGIQCVSQAESELARISKTLSAVSEPAPTEAAAGGEAKPTDSAAEAAAQSPELKRDLSQIRERKQAVEATLAKCRLLAARADELVERLTQLQQRMLRQTLVEKDHNLGELLFGSLLDPVGLWLSVQEFLIQGSGIRQLDPAGLTLITAGGALGLLLGAWSRSWLRRGVRPPDEALGLTGRIPGAVLSGLAFYSLPLATLLGVDLVLAWLFRGLETPPLLAVAGYGLVAYLLVMVLIRSALRPPKPARQITPLSDGLAKALGRRLQMLALLLLLGGLLDHSLQAGELPPELSQLAGAAVVSLLVINSVWLLWLLGRVERLRMGRRLRFLLLLVLLVILVAEWLGYRNLSAYLLTGLLGTLLIGGVFWVLGALVREVLDRLDRGGDGWEGRFHTSIGLGANEPVPGLIWVRLLLWFLIWGTAALLTLSVWGLSEAGFALVFEYLVDGFDVGGLRIVPSKVLLGLGLFALLLMLVSWGRDRMDQKLRSSSRLDAGSRDAMVSVSGYVGIALAILVGLSLAGVDLSNIAIIAGALSVGIGFGLQNIVNNFVSGIILLFERPIRPGDWIVVGNTEGFVQKVRVRATEIQTFDRSDVIVPNSELISGQVTNWTYRDPYGRVICPVGVAYGSDVQLVRKVLLEVAEGHPQVISDGRVPPPKVMFLAFGDSALLFDLRCFISDVKSRLAVRSELNYAIDAAFRANGIQIPFPQQDLYVKGWPPEGGPPRDG